MRDRPHNRLAVEGSPHRPRPPRGAPTEGLRAAGGLLSPTAGTNAPDPALVSRGYCRYAEKVGSQFLSLRQPNFVQPGHIGNGSYLRHR
jgi:hypothetical protein